MRCQCHRVSFTPRSPESTTESLKKHSKTGEPREPSLGFVQEETTNISSLLPKELKCLRKVTSSMHGSQPKSRKVILIDKSPISKTTIRNINSSPTSEAASISKEKVLRKFWNARTQRLSERLWLPTKTGSPDSALSCFDGSSKEKVGKSWFSIERSPPQKKSWSRISSQSLPSSLLESMDSEATIERSRKIQLFPTPKQKRILKEWLGMYRWYYNRTVELVQDTGKFSFFYLRKIMRTKYFQHKSYHSPEWYTGHPIPSRIIDGAIKTCCNNYQVNLKLFREKKVSHFKISFKTKKDARQSIYLNGDLFSKRKNGFCLRYLGENIKSSEPIQGIFRDSRLVYYPKIEKFYLHTPHQKQGDKQAPHFGVIALDPGSRTFLTGYSPNYHTLQIGKNTEKTLEKIHKEMDLIRGKRELTENKRRKALFTTVLARRQKRLTNLIDDLHWKAIAFLTQKYRSIMLGDLSSKKVSSRERYLPKRVKRNLLTLGFYRFRKRLEEKCLERGNEFLLVNEAYTTATCTRCGTVKKIGSSKIRECGICNLVIDRDYNGARNIYLKGWFDKKWNQPLLVATPSR